MKENFIKVMKAQMSMLKCVHTSRMINGRSAKLPTKPIKAN
jgi:hypothetical protein